MITESTFDAEILWDVIIFDYVCEMNPEMGESFILTVFDEMSGIFEGLIIHKYDSITFLCCDYSFYHNILQLKLQKELLKQV